MGEMDEYDGENGTYISFRCPQPLLFTLQSHSPTSLPNLSLCISFSFSLSYLLEVNTNPSLAVQNHWHHDLLKHMAESLFRVAIDPLFPPPSEAARGELHRRADADGIHESLETSGFGEGDGVLRDVPLVPPAAVVPPSPSTHTDARAAPAEGGEATAAGGGEGGEDPRSTVMRAGFKLLYRNDPSFNALAAENRATSASKSRYKKTCGMGCGVFPSVSAVVLAFCTLTLCALLIGARGGGDWVGRVVHRHRLYWAPRVYGYGL